MTKVVKIGGALLDNAPKAVDGIRRVLAQVGRRLGREHVGHAPTQTINLAPRCRHLDLSTSGPLARAVWLMPAR